MLIRSPMNSQFDQQCVDQCDDDQQASQLNAFHHIRLGLLLRCNTSARREVREVCRSHYVDSPWSDKLLKYPHLALSVKILPNTDILFLLHTSFTGSVSEMICFKEKNGPARYKVAHSNVKSSRT